MNKRGEKVQDYVSECSIVASDLFAAGEYQKAKLIYEQNLQILQQTFGMDSPQLSMTLGDLGEVYAALHDYEQAEAYFRQAITLREQASGIGHRLGYNIYRGYEQLLRKLGRDDEANQIKARTKPNKRS